MRSPASAAPPPRAAWVWVGAAGLFLAYLFTASSVHSWDAIAYTARVSGDPLLSERFLSTRLLHPHHLLYVPLAIGFTRASRALGLAGSEPFAPLEALSALGAAGSALLGGLVVAKLSGSAARGLFATLATGVSSAVWSYATEVEVMAPSLCLALLSLYIAVCGGTARASALSGLAMAAAVLVHQLTMWLAIALALSPWIGRRRDRPSHAAIWILTGATVVAGTYIAAGMLAAGADRPSELFDWLLTARTRSTFAEHSPLVVLAQAARGIAGAFVSLEPLAAVRRGGAGAGTWALAVLAALGLGAVLISCLSSAPRALKSVRAREPWTIAVVAGAGILAIFVAWFQPWNPDYWVYLPPLVWIAVGLHFPPRMDRGPAAGAALLLAVLAMLQLVTQALPRRDPARAPYADLLAFARARLTPGGLLVLGPATTGLGAGTVALPFFARVEVLPAPAAGPPDEQAGFRRALAEAVVSWSEGRRRVFAMEDVLPTLRSVAGRELPFEPVGSLRGSLVYELGTRPD